MNLLSSNNETRYYIKIFNKQECNGLIKYLWFPYNKLQHGMILQYTGKFGYGTAHKSIRDNVWESTFTARNRARIPCNSARTNVQFYVFSRALSRAYLRAGNI